MFVVVVGTDRALLFLFGFVVDLSVCERCVLSNTYVPVRAYGTPIFDRLCSDERTFDVTICCRSTDEECWQSGSVCFLR